MDNDKMTTDNAAKIARGLSAETLAALRRISKGVDGIGYYPQLMAKGLIATIDNAELGFETGFVVTPLGKRVLEIEVAHDEASRLHTALTGYDDHGNLASAEPQQPATEAGDEEFMPTLPHLADETWYDKGYNAGYEAAAKIAREQYALVNMWTDKIAEVQAQLATANERAAKAAAQRDALRV